MFQSYQDRAHIYLVYIREAHPVDGPRRPPEQFQIADPKTLKERQQVAEEFAAEVKLSLPILVDTIDDQVEQAYSAWPDRIYILDQSGRIRLKGEPGPRGFQPAVKETPAVLDRLLKRTE